MTLRLASFLQLNVGLGECLLDELVLLRDELSEKNLQLINVELQPP